MSRAIEDLSRGFRPLAITLLQQLETEGLSIMVVDTLRTELEHKANLRAGTSSAIRSFHLPRHLRVAIPLFHPDFNKSDAIDLCPYDQVDKFGPKKLRWDTAHPAWRVIGQLAEDLGCEWGGRWKKPYDPGHVQWPRALWTADSLNYRPPDPIA